MYGCCWQVRMILHIFGSEILVGIRHLLHTSALLFARIVRTF
jgi:hypothetical protein